MWPNPQKTADLITFTEEILNGKLHFLCSVKSRRVSNFVIYYLRNCQWSAERETKKHDLRKIFFIFKILKLLEIERHILVLTLANFCEQLLIILELYFFLGYATKKLQACRCSTVTLNIIFDIYLYLCKVLLFQSNRILIYMIPDYILRSYFTW